MIDLKGKPFNLDDESIQWVEKTLTNMTEDEKIGQLFCLIGYDRNEEYLKNLACGFKPGGLMCRPMPVEEVISTVRILQENSKIPLLISANLEKGGNGNVIKRRQV